MGEDKLGQMISDDAHAARLCQVRMHREPDGLIHAEFAEKAHQSRRSREEMRQDGQPKTRAGSRELRRQRRRGQRAGPAAQDSLDPLGGREMALRLGPTDKAIFVEARRISAGAASLNVAGGTVKSEAQHAKPADRYIAAVGLDHPDREVGISPMQIHGMDISDDLNPQARMSI